MQPGLAWGSVGTRKVTPGYCWFQLVCSLRKSLCVQGLRETLGYLVLRKARTPRVAALHGPSGVPRLSLGQEESAAQTGRLSNTQESPPSLGPSTPMPSMGPGASGRSACVHMHLLVRHFADLTHLGELFGLIPSLSLPLIITPPLGEEVLDLKAVVVITEAASLPGGGVSPRPSSCPGVQRSRASPTANLPAGTL